MASYQAKLSHLRIAPRKVRLVADLVRGMNLHTARHNLQFSTKRASVPILKLLDSAASNAKDIKEDVNEDSLVIREIFVNEGPKLKRFRPVSRGMSHAIEKKTSHITIVLVEQEKSANRKSPIANSKIKTVKPKVEKS